MPKLRRIRNRVVYRESDPDPEVSIRSDPGQLYPDLQPDLVRPDVSLPANKIIIKSGVI